MKKGFWILAPSFVIAAPWKQQIDTGLRVAEAILEGATKLRELRLEAATEAHADAIATQKFLYGATDALALCKLQSEWIAANARRSAAYWQAVGQAVNEADTNGLGCLCSGARISGATSKDPASAAAILRQAA